MGADHSLRSASFGSVFRGEYGQLPAPVNEEVKKKAIGDAEVITCRPADLLSPELEKYSKEAGELAKCEEDVLSYALFPQVASKFLAERNKETSSPEKTTENIVRELYIDDCTAK